MIAVDLLPGRCAVARLPGSAAVPEWVRGAFTAVVRTPAELSIVADEACVPADAIAERGFRAFSVRGPIPFTTVGLLSRLTGALADAGISLFAVSTFDTDWLFVRSAAVAESVAALRRMGVAVHGYPARPVLLFDLLDTLVLDPIHDEIPAFLGVSAAEYFASKDPTAWVEFELGRLDHEGFCARMFADRRPIDPAGLAAAVGRGGGLLPGMAAVLERLAGCEVHVLSNYPSWWRVFAERRALRDRIGRWFVSCETGVRKPDEEAYLGAVRALGCDPSEVVFVDDKARNVDAARAAGLSGSLFTGAPTLLADLERVGILSRT